MNHCPRNSQSSADESRRDAHDFDPVRPGETFTSAHEEFAGLRARCPIARSQEYGGFWALLGYDEVLSVITDIEHFTTSQAERNTEVRVHRRAATAAPGPAGPHGVPARHQQVLHPAEDA